MKPTAAPIETELKLRLDPAALPRVLAHPSLAAVKRGRVHTTRLVGTYYDSPDRHLARAGIALRVRRDGRRWVQAAKGPPQAQSGGGMSSRSEYEWPVRGESLDLLLLATTPWRRHFAKAQRKGGLAPVFTTDIARTSIPVTFADSTMATVALDVGAIRSGRRRETVCELEIELEAGAPARLFELALALAADLPLAIEPRSKAERGHALTHPAKAKPARAEDIELPRHTTAAEALAAIVRNCLRQMEANAEGLVADADPEWIHQMRIGARRLRSALGLARALAPDTVLVPIVAELRRLTRALGPARDLDVFATETLPSLRASIDPSTLGPVLQALARHVAIRRGAARKAAREEIASARFTRLLLASGALATEPSFGTAADSAHAIALANPAREFARDVLRRRHRKLAAAGAPLPSATPAERHVARIAAKKLRYAAEFMAPIFRGKRRRAYLTALSRLQDVLGEMNDATVAATLTRELSPSHAVAGAAVDGWTAARSAALEPELAAAWRAFMHARPFWTRD